MRRLLWLFILMSGMVWGYEPDTLTLSLEEAIMLAIRENPNVQQAQLNHSQQKFALEVQKWQFKPHYAFVAGKSITHNVSQGETQTSNALGVQPQISLLTPIGTQLTLTSNNNIGGHYNPSLNLQVIQPLLRGFGRPIVEAALYNAIDSEKISALNIENALRTTITAVINAYLDVISAENTLEIDRIAIKRAEISVQQTKLFIKAGHKAGVELITVEAEVAKSKAKLETDKNNLDQARFALLTAIGIDPNLKVRFTSIVVPALIKKYVVRDLEQTKKLTLQNDIQYQIDNIMLHGSTRRNLRSAEDNTRWQLNLTVNGVVGNGGGGGANSGFNSLTNGYNQGQSATLNLTIPIDDKNAKLAVLNAKIALQEAQVALKQEKWSKETKAINLWNSINSAMRTLHFAEAAEDLQQKTYSISFQKYSHGLIDSLELQSAHQRLVDEEQNLLAAKINYLKALVDMDQQIGNTLKTWKIYTK